MKHIIMIAFALIVQTVFACDICGGISAPGTMGILPGNEFHFVGLRLNYNSYESYHSTGIGIPNRVTNEYFLRSDLQLRWQLNRKVGFILSAPYHYNVQREDDKRSTTNGIGDISIGVNYLLLDKVNEETEQILRIGSGIKGPTGDYARNAWETSNMDPGSGAWDFSFNTYFTAFKNNWGLLQENVYNLRTKNNVDYKYGNNLLTRLSGIYRVLIGSKTLLLPAIGASYSNTQTDRIKDIPVSSSFNQGHVVNIETGLTLLTNKFMLNLRYNVPAYQNISDGDVKAFGGLEFSTYFLIQKK